MGKGSKERVSKRKPEQHSSGIHYDESSENIVERLVACKIAKLAGRSATEAAAHVMA